VLKGRVIAFCENLEIGPETDGPEVETLRCREPAVALVLVQPASSDKALQGLGYVSIVNHN
jgi:hypothetical protein